MSCSSAADSQRGSSASGVSAEPRLHVAGHADGVALVVVRLAAELREAVGA